MRTLFTVALFLLSLNSADAQPLKQKIASAFENFEKDNNLKYSISSLTVLNAKTGETVYAKNENVGLSTASTLKAITTATAYSVLGGNFKYETDLLYSGEVKDSILNGDIILQGSGDPTLGSENFAETKPDVLLRKWIAAIKKAGIKQISGSLIADDRLLNGQTAPQGWTWEDMGQYYGAGASALNWRENKFKIILSANGAVGAKTQLVRTDPALPYLNIINEVSIGKAGSGDRVYAFSAPYSDKIILRGIYGSDLKKEIEISMPDGAYALVANLQTALQKEGIAIKNGITTAYLMHADGGQVPSSTQLLDRYLSPELSQISYWFLKKSINLYGEALLKTIAIKQGLDPDTEKAAEWEQKFWAAKLGIDQGALRIKDGSGLSPENKLTTMAMAKILSHVNKEHYYGSFFENMPLYNRMKMKSGTIGGVLGYVGYHTASDGTPLVFAFLVNNHEGSSQPMRLKMFKMLDALK